MAEQTTLNPKQIYDKITTGRGSDSLMESTDVARQLHDQLLDRAGEVKRLSAEIGEGWQGPASEAAAGAALPLAKAAEADGDNLGVAGRAIEQQVTDFGMVRNSVVPVSSTKPEMTDEQAIDAILHGDTGAYDRSVADWRDKGHANVQAFSRYHEASGANGEQLPQMYEPLTDPGYPISQSSGSGPGSGGDDASGVQYFPGGGGADTPPAGPPQSGGGTDYDGEGRGSQPLSASTPSDGSVRTPAADGTPPAPGSESTSTSSFSPDTSPGRPGTGYTPGGAGLGDYGGGAHRGQTSLGPYGSSGGGSGGGFGSGGYGGSAGGYGGSSSGSSGSAYGTGRAPGAASGSTTSGPGRSSGVIPRSPGGAGARVGTISGGSGSGSAGTGRGMMPMGAGAGKGQGQNEQHERKTPYVEDANELFGPDHRGTAPEVIGEVRKKR